MTTEFKVTDLTKKEIATLLANLNYGCPYIDIKIAKGSEQYMGKYKSIEDGWANALHDGGEITIIDRQGNPFDIMEPHRFGVHNARPFVVDSMMGEYKAVAYDITLDSILMGCSNNQNAFNCLCAVLDGSGDVWDAYNVIQFALFGEVIYG